MIRIPSTRSVGRRTVALAAMALALSGCARLGHGAGGDATLGYAQPPARDGQLAAITWDLPQGEPTTLDPVKAGDYSPDMVVSNLCDDLFRMDAHWGEHPELATSYAYHDDHRVLVLNIRRGVRFWNGQPLTAADVAYSLQRNMSPRTGAVNGGFFTTVRSIRQTGPYQVTVRFSVADELFLKELDTVVGAVVEKAYVEKVGNHAFGTARGGVMCSGPYELQRWTPGSEIVLARNPHYWDRSLEPRIASVTLKFISDTSVLTSALASGEIDGAYEVPAAAIPALQGTSSGTLHFGHSLELELLSPASSTGLAANPVIRRALSRSIDRAAIAKAIFAGAATPNLALTPPSAWTPGVARPVYRRAYAALAREAGTDAQLRAQVARVPGHRRPIVMAIAGGDQTQLDLATLIEQDAQHLGLDVRIREEQPLSFSNLFYVKSDRKGIDFILTTGFLDIPDQLDYLAYWVFPHSFFNAIGFNDPTVSRLVSRAQSTFDPITRARLLVAAQARYTRAEIVVPIFALPEVSYIARRLAGATTSFAYIFQPSFALMGPS